MLFGRGVDEVGLLGLVSGGREEDFIVRVVYSYVFIFFLGCRFL